MCRSVQEAEDLRGDEDGNASHFGRMFHLPPFAEATPAVRAALIRLGARGGPLDARDNLAAGPVALIVDPQLSAGNPNNDTHTAGTTFLGQFLDHDMTFDTGSRLGRPTNPLTRAERPPSVFRPRFRVRRRPDRLTAALRAGDRAKLRVESGGIFEDLPREADSRAIIADPRNDENVVIAGLQAAMLLAHNRAVVDGVRMANPRLDTERVFAEARRLVTWHYQWIILHEFLPQVVGASTVSRVLADRQRYYRPKQDDAFMPVEFQLTYRMGHSMVRPSYRANFTGNAGSPFFAFIFDPSQEGARIRRICAAVYAAPAGSWAGRLSSGSRALKATSVPTSASTRTCPRRSSTFRSARLRAARRRRRWPSATCCVTSRGCRPRARRSPSGWVCRPCRARSSRS